MAINRAWFLCNVQRGEGGAGAPRGRAAVDHIVLSLLLDFVRVWTADGAPKRQVLARDSKNASHSEVSNRSKLSQQRRTA